MKGITMDTKTIRELAAILREHDLQRINISENNVHISIEAKGGSTESMSVSDNTSFPKSESSDAVVSTEYAGAVKSPLVGTVYLRPDPESQPYVTVGSKVTKGDVLCLVEAMKMYNDIYADRSGTIAEICVVNGQNVEYGQALFVIEE